MIKIHQTLIAIFVISFLINNPFIPIFIQDAPTFSSNSDAAEADLAAPANYMNLNSRQAGSILDHIDLNITSPGTHPNSSIYGKSGGLTGFALAAGDINSDGIEDLIIGAPAKTVNGNISAGMIYVLFGSPSGINFNSTMNLTVAANVTINGSDAGDSSGTALAVSDMNGDGLGDIIIGAPKADGYNNSLQASGEVYAIFGRQVFPSFIELNLSLPGMHQNITFYGNNSNDGFGEELLGADLITDKPGFSDIVVSAPNADGPNNARVSAGEVIIIPGNNSYQPEVIIDTDRFIDSKGIESASIIFGPETGQLLGGELAGGDLNHDGRTDMLVNAYGLGPGGSGRTGCGEVYLFNGRDSWPLSLDLSLGGANATIYGQSSGDYTGYSITTGKLNFDVFDDIVLGAPFADGPDSERVDAGEAYIIYGNGSFSGDIDLDPNLGRGADVTIFGEGDGSNNEQFGLSIALSDHDHDSKPDIFISSPAGTRSDNGDTSGIVYMVSTNAPLPAELDVATNRSISLKLLGSDPDDRAGFDMVSGDLDGIPSSDLIVSAPYGDGFSNSDKDCGELFVIYGKRTPRPDDRGPIVIDISPSNQSIDVMLDVAITITFDEPVVSSSFEFSLAPEPGNWQVLWNSTFEKVVLTHDNFTESVWHTFDIIQANDSIGNNFNNSYWSTLRFLTGDFTPPRILQVSPAEDEVGVNPLVDVVVEFSEEILQPSLKFNITPDPGNWSATEWTPEGTTASFKHSNPFEESQEYRFEIQAAVDIGGNSLSSFGKPRVWNFTTGKIDPILPWVIYKAPADKSSGIAITTAIEMNFSEPMNLAFLVDAISIVPDTEIGDVQWISATNLLRLVPVINLLPNTTYTISLKASATDLSGNDLDGNLNQVPDGSPQDDVVWSFKTGISGDIIPPEILTIRPAADLSNVDLHHLIEVQFSEFMNENSVIDAFEILPFINGSFHWFSTFVAFLPQTDYSPDTVYQVKIKGTARDTSGNGLDADSDGIPEGEVSDTYSWSFTTAASASVNITPPTVIRTLPEAGAKDIPVNTDIEIEFSRNMSWAFAGDSLGVTPTVSGIFKWSQKTLIFNTFGNLKLDIVYTIRVSAIARDIVSRFLDGNGNGVSEGSPIDDYIFTFTTGINYDDQPPTIWNTHPAPDAIEVARNTAIEIKFSEPMLKITTESAFIISPSTTGEIQWLENLMVFKPDAALKPATGYFVSIMNTARDVAGNYFDGNENGIGEKSTDDDYTFSFTTSVDLDLNPPGVLSTSPANGTIGVPLYRLILINFSEPMNKLFFNDAFVITPDISGTISWINNTMEFAPVRALNPETVYTVTVTFRAEDISGNGFDGNGDGKAARSLEDNFQFQFRTGQEIIIITGTKLISIEPASGEKDVGLYQKIILRFDSPMTSDEGLLIFNCTPEPGGWDLSWSNNNQTVTLSHNKFKVNTEYTFSLLFAIDINGRQVTPGPVPSTWKFTTAKESQAEDGDYTIGGIKIDAGTLTVILSIILLWILIIVIIAVWTLLKMGKKKEEDAEESGDEEDSERVREEEGDEEDLEALPPPPDDVPEVPAGGEEDELDELPPPPSEEVPEVPAEGGEMGSGGEGDEIKITEEDETIGNDGRSDD